MIRGDSFLPFLIGCARRGRRLLPVLALPLYLALYALRLLSDRDAKERLIQAFFVKKPAPKIDAHSERSCTE
jgi:hypothetical protein